MKTLRRLLRALLPLIVLAVMVIPFANPASPVYASTTDSFYPDAHPESTSVDGSVFNAVTNQSWATVIGGAGTGSNDTTPIPYLFNIDSGTTADKWDNADRSIFLFDTSAIPDGSTITAATITFTTNGVPVDNLNISPSVAVYGATPASNTALAGTDYANVGNTVMSGVLTWASIPKASSALITFTLNATGLAAISATGVSKFSVRNANYDVAGVAPTWSSNQYSRIKVFSADAGSTTVAPKLSVTYTPPPSVFYPNAHAEATSVDGEVSHAQFNVTWATILGGAGSAPTNADNANTALLFYITSGTAAGQWRGLTRGVFLFDTSSLPDAAVVTSATISLYTYSKLDQLSATPGVAIYGSTPASNTALADTDYVNVGNTALSSTVAWGDITEGGYTVFTLNATGRAAISTTGVSKFSSRMPVYDVAATEPPWVAGIKSTGVNFYTADNGSNKPTLTLTYALPPTVTTSTTYYKDSPNSAVAVGTVISNGYEDPTTVGVEWDVDSGAPYANDDNKATTGTTSNFDVRMTGLPVGTTIYYRTYATNSAGTGYGAEQSFSTLENGELATLDSATYLGGNLSNPIQRQCVYAEGRYWFFGGFIDDTVDGYRFGFISSTDLITWSAPTSLGTTAGCNQWTVSVWFDGTYIHYATVESVFAAGSLYYRRGDPSPGGTITWSAAQQTVTTDVATSTNIPNLHSITVDSSGHAYIAYMAPLYYGRVIRNDNVDGTWSTSAGFPYALTSSMLAQGVSMVPLGDGVYVVCNDNAYPINQLTGRLYSGGSWGSVEHIPVASEAVNWYMPAVERNGTIVVVSSQFLGDYSIDASTRSTSGVWTVERICPPTASNGGNTPLLLLSGLSKVGNDLVVFIVEYLNEAVYTLDHVYYVAYTDGEWKDPVDWIDETLYDVHDPDWANSVYSVPAGVAPVLFYTSEKGLPTSYMAKYAGLYDLAQTTPYSAKITVNNTSSTSYSGLAIRVATNNRYLSDHGFISPEGRDVKVSRASTDFPRMLVDDTTLFYAPVPNNSVTYATYSTSNMPTDMTIIPGNGGFITTKDAAVLEMGSNFRVLSYVYLDGGVGDDILFKNAAIDIYQSTATAVKAEITGGTSVTATGVAAGWHLVDVSADGANLSISIDSGAATTSALGGVPVPDNANNYVWLDGVPMATYLKLECNGSSLIWYQPQYMVHGAIYSAGTVTVTNGDATVEGAGGAAFTSSMVGGIFVSADGVWYTVSSVTDGTHLELTTTYAGGTLGGQAYNMYPKMVDRFGVSQDGAITLGSNPAGVSLSIGVLSSSYQPEIGQVTGITAPLDMMPEAPSGDWFRDPDVSSSLLTNPFRPLVLLISDNTSLTESQTWRYYGIVLLVFVLVLTAYAVRGHYILTGIAVAATFIGLVALTIFPYWSLVFVIFFIVGGWVAERTTQL